MELSAQPKLDYVPLNDESESWKEWSKRHLHILRFYIIIAFIIGLVLTILLQEMCYLLATWGCSPSALEGYESPFGNDMVPDDLILLEDYHYFWNVFLATKTDAQGLKKDLVVGYFYQIWGPFAYTTAFRDSFGHTVFASVRKLIHFESSNLIYRCDGKDEVYTVTESINWFMNRIRRLFGTFKTSEYYIYRGDELVGVSEEVGYTTKSLLIHFPKTEEPIAEASLTKRNVHGSYDEWIVHQRHHTHELTNSSLPAFVSAMATSLMAFQYATEKNTEKNRNAAKIPTADSDTSTTSNLASRPRLRIGPLITAATDSTDVAGGTMVAPLNFTATRDGSSEVTAQDASEIVTIQDASHPRVSSSSSSSSGSSGSSSQ